MCRRRTLCFLSRAPASYASALGGIGCSRGGCELLTAGLVQNLAIEFVAERAAAGSGKHPSRNGTECRRGAANGDNGETGETCQDEASSLSRVEGRTILIGNSKTIPPDRNLIHASGFLAILLPAGLLTGLLWPRLPPKRNPPRRRRQLSASTNVSPGLTRTSLVRRNRHILRAVRAFPKLKIAAPIGVAHVPGTKNLSHPAALALGRRRAKFCASRTTTRREGRDPARHRRPRLRRGLPPRLPRTATSTSA